MSGHSKWSTIKRKKEALDAKRGKLFTKLIKEISVAAREGGADVEGNSRLRLAVQNAKGANIPKDKIEKAILKATGADAENYMELTFEGYGLHGVGIFVECLSDNNNRTISSVRSLFKKHHGHLVTNGSLNFIFDRKGIFELRPGDTELDKLELELIDSGAEEIEGEGEEILTVTCALEDFGNLNKRLEDLRVDIANAELRRIPNDTKILNVEDSKKVLKLIDSLEDDEDVQNVYHNLEMTEELQNALEDES